MPDTLPIEGEVSHTKGATSARLSEGYRAIGYKGNKKMRGANFADPQ